MRLPANAYETRQGKVLQITSTRTGLTIQLYEKYWNYPCKELYRRVLRDWLDGKSATEITLPELKRVWAVYRDQQRARKKRIEAE